MSIAKKLGLTVGAVAILGVGGYTLAKYNTGSYAHILYEKAAKDHSDEGQKQTQPSTKEKAVKVNDTTKTEKSDSVAKTLKQQNFNGAYAVIKDGKVSDSKTVGKGVENNKLYQVADLENALTAAAVMKLIDDGKLSLSTPISKFYSDSLEISRRVTVKSLLDMTSGITNSAVPNNQLQQSDDVLQWNLNHANTGTSGTYNYQDINYVLLEGIVSQVSGMSYQQYITNNFLKPNNLNDVKFVNKISDPAMATPLNNGQKVSSAVLAKDMNSQMGMNQVMASPKDYLKLMQVLVKTYGNKQGFATVSNQNMTGQLVSSADGFYGSGGIQGYKTAVQISKDGKSGIILMSNNSNGRADDSNVLLEIAKKAYKVND